jgi:hypothetical protein
MAHAQLTSAQIQTLVMARQHCSKADRQAIKKEVFAVAKARYGIPADLAIKALTRVTSAGESASDVGVLKTKSGERFDLADDGLWVNAVRQPAPGTKYIVFQASQVQDALRNALDDGSYDQEDLEVFDSDPALGNTALPTGAVVVTLDAQEYANAFGL